MDKITDYRYVQKSKLFLLPLLEIKKDIFIKPIGTYLKDSSRETKDYQLIVPFKKDDSSEFNYYESNYIVNCKYLVQDDYYETPYLRIYTFDLSSFSSDFDKFLIGKYTEFSNKVKTLINFYWGRTAGGRFFPNPAVDSYLHPTLSDYQEISQHLRVPLDDLIKIKEILDPPNLKMEVFNIQSFKNKINVES